MIGFGILEIGLLSLGAIYIYNLLNSKGTVQYIELDQNQFSRLQDTLVVHNIIPGQYSINPQQNQVIPPSYEELTPRYTTVQENNNIAIIDVTPHTTTIIDDSTQQSN